MSTNVVQFCTQVGSKVSLVKSSLGEKGWGGGVWDGWGGGEVTGWGGCELVISFFTSFYHQVLYICRYLSISVRVGAIGLVLVESVRSLSVSRSIF